MGIKKILLLVPAESASGGIKNYFQVLKNEFDLPVEYMVRGARNWPYRNFVFNELRRALNDYCTFKKRLKKGDIELVQTSTSLGAFSIVRDGIYINYANKKGLKTIIFFRGWNLNTENKIEKYYLWLFKFFLFQTNKIIVLASSFKEKLIHWGYTRDIFVETTIIDKNLLLNINSKVLLRSLQNRIENRQFNLLFLARVEIPKGIYEAINTFKIIQENIPKLIVKLRIAGIGKELDNVRDYVKVNKLTDIIFCGYVEKEDKKNVFLDSDAYIFPSYTEGMPNSVLEAMAFGLPIITRSVGAIPDIISQGENGFYTASKDPKVFAVLIQYLIDNPELRFKMCENNHITAVNRYTTSKVKERIEEIYRNTINETPISAT